MVPSTTSVVVTVNVTDSPSLIDVVDSEILNVAGISVTDTGRLSVTATPEVDPLRITNENVLVPSLIGSLILFL